jgi:ribosomal protein L30
MAEEKIVAAEAAGAEEKAPAKKPAEKAAPKKEAAEKKAPAKRAPAKKKGETVTIKLTKSLIGRGEKQIATAKALGLKKAGDVTTQPDNAATRGKINRISHMVEVVKA